jgi:hypothetical protein
MSGCGASRQQNWFLNKMLDADVLPANARPAGYVITNIHVQEVAIVDADASIRELWDLQRAIVHLLQREAANLDVCSCTKSMLAVFDASRRMIVFGTAIATVNDDWRPRKSAQVLKC